MPPSKTPEEIADLTEQLTGQPARNNQAHALWTHMWVQLDEIRNLLYLQTKYLELYLTEHLDYSTDDITEFIRRSDQTKVRNASRTDGSVVHLPEG